MSEDDRAFWAHLAEEDRPSTIEGVQVGSDSEESNFEEYSDSESEGELYENTF